jgi:hypothetical protein
MVELTPRAEGAVAANLATPCVRNERSLLACALAAARTGDDVASRRLEQAADALGMQGYEAVFEPVRVRIAVTRGEAAFIRGRLPLRVPPPSKNWWRLTTTVAGLEASLAIGDGDAVEREAARLIGDDTLMAAFAGRAAGIVRGDVELRDRAERRLMELGIDPVAALRA